MPRRPVTSADRPYRLLRRELGGRLREKGKTRKALATALKMPESALHSVFLGYRPLPEAKIPAAARFLAHSKEDPVRLEDVLAHANAPNASRVRLIREMREPVRIGYLEWPPFAEGSGPEPKTGLLVELMTLLKEILGLEDYKWEPIEFPKLVESVEDVDIVLGFVLETLSRRAICRFVPFYLPFSVGLNAVAPSSLVEFDSPLNYRDGVDTITRLADGTDRPLLVAVVEGELADEYLPAFLPGIKPVRDAERNIEEAIKYYATRRDKDFVVCADAISCQRIFRQDGSGRLRLVFKEPVGRFQGGFLLPPHDPEWEDYVRETFIHLLSSRLPKVGEIMSRYASKTSEILNLPPVHTNSSVNTSGPFSSRFVQIDDWYFACWPDQIPWPTEWAKQWAPKFGPGNGRHARV